MGTNNMYIWEAMVAVMAAPTHPSSNAFFHTHTNWEGIRWWRPKSSLSLHGLHGLLGFHGFLDLHLGHGFGQCFFGSLHGLHLWHFGLHGLGLVDLQAILHEACPPWCHAHLAVWEHPKCHPQIQLVHPLVLQQRRSSGQSGLVPSSSGMADLLVSFLDSILVAFMEFMATFMLVFMAFMVESLGAMAALGRRWMHLQVVAQASLGLWNGFHKKVKTHDHM